MPYRAAALMVLLCTVVVTAADISPIARKLPPAGVKIADTDRQKIEAELAKVQARIAALAGKPTVADVLPDVQVYEKAVRYALLHGEFYEAKKPATPARPANAPAPRPAAPKPATKPATPRGVAVCLELLKTAGARLDELESGKSVWTTAKGTLVRGYISDIDGSPQPYGLDIGKDVDFSKPVPLYVWLHGRGDTETDLYFIASRQSKRGEVKHDDAIVLHPLGRQCVGYKNAGEIDVLDAIESVKKRYKIDENRIVLCGFSMGGAGAWHIGAHFADQFCVVQPGAGFVDVQKYQNLDPAKTPVAERTLWGQYDVPDYVRNLRNTNVISYSGENDKQRASANLMAEVFKADGRELTQFIGPKVEHKYLPLPEMLAKIDGYVKQGRNPRPAEVHLQTKTLRYNKQFWVEVTGLEEHWKEARVDAKFDGKAIKVDTKNVASLRIYAPWAKPEDVAGLHIPVTLNGMAVFTSLDPTQPPPFDQAGWGVPRGSGQQEGPLVQLGKTDQGWSVYQNDTFSTTGFGATARPLKKIPGLQGPIDDAFMSPFLFVAPTGTAASPAVAVWTAFEMKHQQDRWRALMRGDLRIKNDTDVTADDIAKYNLVLWGDARSNKVIADLASKLPATWADGKLAFGGKTYDAATTVPALIYPNPKNPTKYVVLNSGLTFREAHDGTNSQQNPKLGDWAIIDITTPPTATAPGNVVANGFFDESWKVK